MVVMDVQATEAYISEAVAAEKGEIPVIIYFAVFDISTKNIIKIERGRCILCEVVETASAYREIARVVCVDTAGRAVMNFRVKNAYAGAVKSIHAIGPAAVQAASVNNYIAATAEIDNPALAGFGTLRMADSDSVERNIFAVTERKDIDTSGRCQDPGTFAENAQIRAVFNKKLKLSFNTVTVPGIILS